MRPLMISLLACALVGCIDGLTPPDPTPTIPIAAGSYTLGLGDSTKLQCSADLNADPYDRCDSGTGGSDVAAYIEALSWVPTATATLSAFSIDAHEVTNLQYARCVDHDACTEPAYTMAAELSRYYDDSAYDDHPVVWVSQKQAAEYCAFVGGKLPTEAQWEAAARGSGGKTFPWGEDSSTTCSAEGQPDLVVFRECETRTDPKGSVPMTVDYSERDKTALGVRNMASNVAEWVRDGWSTYAYCKGGAGYNSACQKDPQKCAQCTKDGAACAQGCNGSVAICSSGGVYDPAPASSSAGVIRGGSYLLNRCFHRLYVRRRGTVADEDLGFRCVFEGGGS